jgi:thiamine biosynthesis lipoprotein
MAVSFSLRAFGTTAVVAVANPEELLVARSILLPALRDLDLACSRFRDDSELQELNRAAGVFVPVGDLLWESIVAALAVARMTDGLVDPTVGRAMRYIGYDSTFSRVRIRDGMLVPAVFVPAGRFTEIELDSDRRSVRIPAEVELDLGASAKALAADRISGRIADAIGSGALVSLGGDIAVAGEPPEGGWVVAIDDDHSTLPALTHTRVAIASGGLASSGIRVRRWRTVLGEMHHILDPRTGRPVRGPWATVAVAAATCLEANAASTAALVVGNNAPAWLDQRSLPSRLSRVDGTALCLAGWPADLRAA